VAALGADDGDSGDTFGSSVAVSDGGETVLVGAAQDADPNGNGSGSAYVFTREGSSWRQQAKLAPDDGDPQDQFGTAVALSGDGSTALVGAFHDDEPNGNLAGSAYIFIRDGSSWTRRAKLAADDGTALAEFGFSLSLSRDGTRALIGARHESEPNGSEAGAAYVFDRSGGTWTQRAKLVASDGSGGDAFGVSVSLSTDGSTALIGADGNDGGSAYVFAHAGDSWTQRAKLVADDVDSRDSFGDSVALSGDGTTVLIGSFADDASGQDSGSAYVFARDGDSWTRQTKLTPTGNGDEFGASVALSRDGSTALLGAPEDADPNGFGAGSAFVFAEEGSSWQQQVKLAANDGDINHNFGNSVSLDGDSSTAIIGARYTDRGRAYLFRV